jgi:hypothetical protein
MQVPRETTKKAARIFSVLFTARNKHFPNTSHKCYSFRHISCCHVDLSKFSFTNSLRLPLLKSRDRVVDICDWLRAGRPRGRSSSPGGGRNFHFSKSSRPALGSTQHPIQWIPDPLYAGVKRPGREADHSPPTSAKVKKM